MGPDWCQQPAPVVPQHPYEVCWYLGGRGPNVNEIKSKIRGIGECARAMDVDRSRLEEVAEAGRFQVASGLVREGFAPLDALHMPLEIHLIQKGSKCSS